HGQRGRGPAPRPADHPRLLVRQARGRRGHRRPRGVGTDERGERRPDPRDRRRGRALTGPVTAARLTAYARDNSDLSGGQVTSTTGYNRRTEKVWDAAVRPLPLEAA